MAEEILTDAAAPVAQDESAPVETGAEAAKPVAEASPKEDATLLGKEEAKEEKAPVVVPEKYEIKVPEGMTVDAKMLDVLTPVFKELNISQEGAQKLADTYAPYINQLVETQKTTAVAEFGKMVGEWKAETIKELGNDHAKEIGHAGKFIDKFGGPELRQVLNETGLGNHIAVVKAFIAAGKAIATDSFPDSNLKGKQLDTEEAKAGALFPSMKQ
jgi:hypothetical protein